MEFFLELIIGFILELIGQAFIEVLVEIGIRGSFHSLGISKPKNLILATFGYLFLALIFGGISLYFFPDHVVKVAWLRIANLILTPLAVGGIMAFRGRLLQKNNKVPLRIDSFTYGFAFAFTFGLVRFYFGK